MESDLPVLYNRILPHTTLRQRGMESSPCCCRADCIGITLLSQPPEDFPSLFSLNGNVSLEQDEDGYYFDVTGAFEIVLSQTWMQRAGNSVQRPGGFEIELDKDSFIGQNASIQAVFYTVREMTFKAWYDAITLYYSGDYNTEEGKIAQNTYSDPLSPAGWDADWKPVRFRVMYEGVEDAGVGSYRGPAFLHCSAGTYAGAEITSCSTALAYEQYNPSPSPSVIFGAGVFKIRNLLILNYFSAKIGAERKSIPVQEVPELEEGQYSRYYYSMMKTLPDDTPLPADCYFIGETIFGRAYDSQTNSWSQIVVGDYPRSMLIFMSPPWTNQTIYEFAAAHNIWNGMVLLLPQPKEPCKRRACTIFQSSKIENDTTFKKPWLSEPWIVSDTPHNVSEESALARQGKHYTGSIFFQAEETGDASATIGFYYKTAEQNPTISVSIYIQKTESGYDIYRNSVLQTSISFGEWAALHFVRREKRVECFLMTQSEAKRMFFTYISQDWLYQLEASSSYHGKCFVRFAYVPSIKLTETDSSRVVMFPEELGNMPETRKKCGGYYRAEFPCSNACLEGENLPSAFLAYVSFDVILQPFRAWYEQTEDGYRLVHEYLDVKTVSWSGTLLLSRKETINGELLFAAPALVFKKGPCPGLQGWGMEGAYSDAVQYEADFPYPIFISHVLSFQMTTDQLYEGCRLRPVAKICIRGCKLKRAGEYLATVSFVETGTKSNLAVPVQVSSSDFVYDDSPQPEEMFDIYNKCSEAILVDGITTTESTSAEGNVGSAVIGSGGGPGLFFDSIQAPSQAPCSWSSLIGTTRDGYPPGANYSLTITGVQ